MTKPRISSGDSKTPLPDEERWSCPSLLLLLVVDFPPPPPPEGEDGAVLEFMATDTVPNSIVLFCFASLRVVLLCSVRGAGD